MKKVFLLISISFLVNKIYAQTVPNGGFENWSTDYYFDEPNFGITTNLQSFYLTQAGNVQKSTDAYAGNFAAKLTTVGTTADTLPGVVFIGTPNGNDILGGIPVSVRPDSLICYAKFNIQPNDTGAILVAFKKLGMPNAIGSARILFTGTQSTYQYYSAAINWIDPFTVPDSLVGFFTSSSINGNPAIPGSELFLDNVGFVGALGAPSTNFETWNTIESLEPDNWWTPNFVLINQTPCVTRSTDAHSGLYALRIENVLSNGGDTLGFATNGYFGEEDFMGGMAVTLNPTKVTGYYKYTPVGNDSAIVGAFMSKYDVTFGVSVRLDSMLIKLPAASSYTYFEVLLNYNGWPIADSLNITFVSGNFNDDTSLLVPGSVLLIDDLEVFYNPVSVQDVTFEKAKNIYPNPAQNVLYIKLDKNNPKQLFSLYDAKGALVFEGNCEFQDGTIAAIDISAIPQGLYFYQLNNGTSNQSGKLTIQR